MGGLALPCQETRDCPTSRYGPGGVSESSDHQSWECGTRNREGASSPQSVNIVVRAQTNTVGETPATTCTAELIRKCLLRPGSANCFGPHRQPEICASRYGNDTLLPGRRHVAEVRARIVRSPNVALTHRESQRASRGGTPFRFCRSYQRMTEGFLGTSLITGCGGAITRSSREILRMRLVWQTLSLITSIAQPIPKRRESPPKQGFSGVGLRGFEPPTFGPPDRRANQAAPQPV